MQKTIGINIYKSENVLVNHGYCVLKARSFSYRVAQTFTAVCSRYVDTVCLLQFVTACNLHIVRNYSIALENVVLYVAELCQATQ